MVKGQTTSSSGSTRARTLNNKFSHTGSRTHANALHMYVRHATASEVIKCFTVGNRRTLITLRSSLCYQTVYVKTRNAFRRTLA
jgi:hypothetical protein